MNHANHYVAYSPNESAVSSGAGFWSNEHGWVNFSQSDMFTKAETETLNLPMSTGQDARWVLWEEAEKSYGEVNQSVASAFRFKVANCINCMLQDDARGETMVFIREEGKLTPKVVDAAVIDLDNLQQYEMILFDGGNSAGDLWKHTFYPKLLQDHFLNENPLPQAQLAPYAMEVSVDGGLTYQPAPSGVRIIYKDVIVDGEDGLGEVHINATHEGLITDIWATRDEPLDHNIGTDSELIDDIVTRLVDANN